MTLVFWEVCKRINEEVLNNERAEYGKGIVSTVSSQLKKNYGDSFGTRNVRRMMQFAEIYHDLQIVNLLTQQLSWPHFVELFPIKINEVRNFYAHKLAEEGWSV